MVLLGVLGKCTRNYILQNNKDLFLINEKERENERQRRRKEGWKERDERRNREGIGKE